MTAIGKAQLRPNQKSRMDMHKYRRQMLREVFAVLKQDETVLSRQVPDDDLFQNVYREHALLEPSYGFTRLYTIYEESDVLQSCVEAMQQNVDGFGYKLQFLGDDMKEKEVPEAQAEFQRVKDFMDHANENESWMLVRKKMREDLEVLGNSAVELIRNLRGELTLAYHAPFKNLRISAKTGRAITVPCQIPRDGKIVTIRVKKYFRKYCQISSNGKRMRWFKEFGDPRVMDAITGDYVDKKPRLVASEMWHHKLFFGGMAYGLPRWIGAVLQVMGRRSAQFVNYDLFENQGIPPMAILVSGGVLTDESLEELEEIIKSIRGVSQWNRIMILESNVEGVGLEDKGSAKLELKNLAEYRKEDQMFNKYLTTTERDTRHRFRLPPLYTGQSETFTYACQDEITETLTENGWRFYEEIKDTEKIATIAPETGRLEYHIPEEFHLYDFDGEMISFQTRGVDSVVTPNHDMWLSCPTHKTDPNVWKKVRAEVLESEITRRYKFRVAPRGVVDGMRPDEDLPHEDFELFLEWIGYMAADGNAALAGTRLSFNIKKERKKRAYGQATREMADVYGCKFSYRKDKREGYVTYGLSGNKELHDWCRENLYMSNGKKRLPVWTLHLDHEDSKLLLDSLVFGDGSTIHTGPNSQVYVTTSKFLADQVQILAFRIGFRARVVERPDSRENRKTAYCVNMTKTSTQEIQKKHISKIPYKGKVYCFNVKNHLFVTRRNGKISIHGNTAKAAQTVAEEQVFVPERIEFDEPMNNKIVMGELKVTRWKYISKGPRIVGSQEITKGIEVFSKAGAFTINHAIERANEAFGLDMSKFDLPFAKFPITVVIEMLKQGMPIAGLEDLQGDALESNLKQLPGGKQPKQLLLPGPTEKMFKSDIFSDTEKSLYKLLIGVQHAVENAACQHESSL